MAARDATGPSGRSGQAQPAAAVTLPSVLAGLATSALYTSATYPVHRVKILIQTQDANPKILAGHVPRFSFTQSFRRLLQEQGVVGLWRGNVPYLLRHVPSIALSFTFKDALRQRLSPYYVGAGPWTTLALNAGCGGAAGAIALGMIYPFEFVNIRMAAATSNHQFGVNMREAWREAIKQEGFMSSYRGFGVALASTLVYKGLYFGLYDTAKAYVIGDEQSAKPATSAGGLTLRTGLAAATTYVSASISYPFDIIRKRLIVDLGAEAPQYHGSFRRCVRTIFQREGIAGFYRFYWWDMGFRVWGGFVLVGFDVFQALLQDPPRHVPRLRDQ